jgi:hypothetical protein
MRSFDKFTRDPKLVAQFEDCFCAGKTLRPKFKKIAVFRNRLNHAAGPRGRFQQQHILSGLFESIGAGQARNSRADHDGKWSGSHDSERLREERLGVQLLLFEVRVEKHRQIANENAAEPGSANLVSIDGQQTILAW